MRVKPSTVIKDFEEGYYRRGHGALPANLSARVRVTFPFRFPFLIGAMSIVVAPPSDLRRVPVFRTAIPRWRRKFPKQLMYSMMKDGSSTASNARKNGDGVLEGFSFNTPDLRFDQGVDRLRFSSGSSDLRFDRLQPSESECDCKHKRAFGRFIAREALIDEEFWTASWLRAESHWEDRAGVRHVDSFKRKFAEQEFSALKRRCSGQQLSEKCTCIIVVKKEEKNVKRTVLSSIVGTLDLSIRHLLCGETFPGDRLKAPVFSGIFGRRRDQPVYGYISNLCVAKYARRQGIACNMMLLALEAAKSYGANQIFVHVHKDNMAAQKLYKKIGFEIVEMAMPQSLEEQNYLLWFNN